MKLRQAPEPIDEREEEELAREIGQLAGRGTAEPGAPTDLYWQNLIIRTNQKLDRAASGKALTISWAARVAIPGVVAVLSFLIGLRYFAPVHEGRQAPLKSVVLAMSDQAVDTLLVDPWRASPAVSAEDLGIDLFTLPNEQLAEYLIVNGKVSTLEETLTEEQITDVIAALGAGSAGRAQQGTSPDMQ